MNDINTSGEDSASKAWGGTPKFVSLAAREEIARDLNIRFDRKGGGDIWSEATEPTNKSMIWWPVDPTSGVRIGRARTYSKTLSQWVEDPGSEFTSYAPRKRRNGRVFIAAGTSAITVTFETMGTTDYHITWTATTMVSDGTSFAAAPANLTGFGGIVTGKSVNQFTASFFAAPTGGISIGWEVATTAEEERLS